VANRARHHRFWQGAIAILCGTACMTIAAFLLDRFWIVNKFRSISRGLYDSSDPAEVGLSVLLGLIAAIATLGVYTWLTRYDSIAADGEFHCRKCGYVLRGLSEPRCPECGEPI
jgi:hypothetical protein